MDQAAPLKEGSRLGVSGDGASPTPPHIPDHQVLRRIGGGSYGEIWLCRNSMGTYRAAKLVRRKTFEHERPFERELSGIRKFEPISRLHEGFVDILHVGIDENEGFCYYLMELGDDRFSGQHIEPETYFPKTLASEIARCGRLSSSDCLELGLKLSSALAELHKCGLVHRDVKPSNIIFVNGIPKLADIGLVAEIQEARSYVGTEGFIPPEGPGSPQADVYSLGKVLYEACTGKDRQAFPDLPVNFDQFPDCELLVELNVVITHCCISDPKQRYASAFDLNADLLVLRNGKSVKRLKLLERRLSRLKRVGGVTALFLLLLGAIVFHAYREWKISVESRQMRVGSDLAYGNVAMETGDLLRALPYFVDALRLDSGETRKEAIHRLRVGNVLAQCPKLTHFWMEETQLKTCEFSPNDKQVLISQHYGAAKIYDLKTGRLCGHPFGEGVGTAAYSPDGKLIITAGNRAACVWDSNTMERIRCLSHPTWVSSAKFSPDASRVVTAGRDGKVRIWDIATGEMKLELTHNTNAVLFANFNHNGKLIVSTGADRTAAVWDAAGGQCLKKLANHTKWVNYAAFSPDDAKLVTACEDHKARVWKVADWSRIFPDLGHPDVLKSAEFSPDGKLILTASLDGSALLWRADTLEPLNPNPVLRHNERLVYAAFDHESRRIISACTDGAVRIWDLAGSLVAATPTRRTFSDDASRFFELTNDHIRIAEASTGSTLMTLPYQAFDLEHVALSRNGRVVMAISPRSGSSKTNHFVQVWDTASGKPITDGFFIDNVFRKALVTDDGRYLASYDSATVEVWEVATGKKSANLPNFRSVTAVVFAPDSRQIAVAAGSAVELWAMEGSWRRTATLEHAAPVSHIEYDRSGSRFLSSCSDAGLKRRFAQLWDPKSGQRRGPELTHRDGVTSACFSPDGRLVATASEDFTACVWSADTGKQFPVILKHLDEVRTVAFSSDSKQLVTAGVDRTARLWDVSTGFPLAPPFRHASKLFGACFLSDSGYIMTSSGTGDTWTWKLSSESRPVADLVRYARVLSSGVIEPSDTIDIPLSASLMTNYNTLRSKYPADFEPSRQEIIAWHEFQAEQSKMEHDERGAWFHCKILQEATAQP